MMRNGKSDALPGGLARLQQRFTEWRKARRARTRIPDSLWRAAVKAADSYGVCKTASTLRLDYYALKKRVEQQATDGLPAKSPIARGFVEVAPPLTAMAAECTVEFEDVAGARMRIHLKGYEAPDLVALGRSFWNAE